MKRKHRLAEATKKVSSSPFKPSGVSPEPSGKGSQYGTIEQQWPIMSAELDMSKFPEKKADNIRETKANFVSRPPKKGGFGYANVGIGASFEYQTEPYDRRREQEVKYEADAKKKIISKQPFVSCIMIFSSNYCANRQQPKELFQPVLHARVNRQER
jgi:hypothetical protein